VLVSTLLGVLKRRWLARMYQHLLSALDEEDRPVGMAMYSAPPEAPAANLWYLAVEPRARNNGIGVTIYREILRRIAAPVRQVLVYEVEIPDGQDTYAQHRIHFYQRQGAHQLKGIHYMQYVGWHQPPMPMHLMVHLLQPLEVQAVDRKVCMAMRCSRLGCWSLSEIRSLVLPG
jgi:GNAT superfamily N-acetyltransferase